jgi:ribonuclease P protein component
MRFRPEQHLRRQVDIRGAREKGSRIDCGAYTLWWRPTPAGTAGDLRRMAVSASIAMVGGSVKRSRAKRRLREVFRRHQGLVPVRCDLLLVARAAVNAWAFTDLERKFTEACARIHAAAAPRA